MIVVIIADSFKKGMKSRGCPALLPHNKTTNLFQQQCESIKRVFPKSEIIYIYGFDGKRFESFVDENPKINKTQYLYNKDHSIFSHGKSLSLAQNYISKSNECLIVLGYDPIYIKDIKGIKESKKSCLVLSKHNDSKIGCIIEENTANINHIFFDLDNQIADIYFLKKPEINILNKFLSDESIYNMFLFEIMNKILHNNGQLTAL